MNRLIERLYIGDIKDAGRPSLLDTYGITAVLSLTHCNPDPGFPPDTKIKSVPLIDGPQNDLEKLESAAEALVELHESKEVVLVHCSAGASRSVTTAAIALTRLANHSLRDGFRHIEERHSPFDPHQALIRNSALIVKDDK